MYIRYIGAFVAKVPEIIRTRNLRALDHRIGRIAKRFQYRNIALLFDARYCDEQVQDGSYTFGLIREIYIRDCYFRHFPSAIYHGANVVVDIGANRGVFSVLMAATARRVVAVEAQEHFRPVIQRNMQINGFKNYSIEVALIGKGGILAGSPVSQLTMEELFDRNGLNIVDLVKLDIEGSEFALFRNPGWLNRVRAISMEVHQHHGSIEDVLDEIRRHDVKYVLANEDLDQIVDSKLATFVYAWKLG